MMNPDSPTTAQAIQLSLLLTPPHECGYLSNYRASTLFVDPGLPMDGVLYQGLLERGFRRSGGHVYRPYCSGCDQCIPVRIPVDRFEPSRNMRRVLRRNRDVTTRVRRPVLNPEWFALYNRYLATRHAGGPMADPKPEDFIDFLTTHWAPNNFVEFFEGDRLLMVAVTDYLSTSLSAVYTFFDPDAGSRSLGTLAILWQIQEAQRMGKSWLYLGYWIAASTKMAYKARFKPLEAYRNRKWEVLTPVIPGADSVPGGQRRSAGAGG